MEEYNKNAVAETSSRNYTNSNMVPQALLKNSMKRRVEELSHHRISQYSDNSDFNDLDFDDDEDIERYGLDEGSHTPQLDSEHHEFDDESSFLHDTTEADNQDFYELDHDFDEASVSSSSLSHFVDQKQQQQQAQQQTSRCRREGCNRTDRGTGLCHRHGGRRLCSVLNCNKGDVGGGYCSKHGGGKRCQFEYYTDDHAAAAVPCMGTDETGQRNQQGGNNSASSSSMHHLNSFTGNGEEPARRMKREAKGSFDSLASTEQTCGQESHSVDDQGMQSELVGEDHDERHGAQGEHNQHTFEDDSYTEQQPKQDIAQREVAGSADYHSMSQQLVRCTRADIGGGFCAAHGGGKRCIIESCGNVARHRSYCVRHGAAIKCRAEGCTKHARGSKGSNGYCVQHGGGHRCAMPDCVKVARTNSQYCQLHGGGALCSVENCGKLVASKGRCSAHGGKQDCSVPGCTKKVRSQGVCITHGGGSRCLHINCTKLRRKGGFCAAHGKVKPEVS